MQFTPVPDVAERILALNKQEPFDVSSFGSIEGRNELKSLRLSTDQLKQIMSQMELCFQAGLSAEDSAVKMIPTFVRATSVGGERGKFLALDLGGSKFRVLVITMNGDGVHSNTDMKSKTYELNDELQKGTGEALFDHVAQCLADSMEENSISGENKLPLGFTFSFPCQQDGLTSARLLSWTKGFKASGCVGEDVVELLRAAICRKGLTNIDVVALINDTTGTMLACSFVQEHCYIGLIVGTGCNACYMEKIEAIPKLNGTINAVKDGLPPEMCINTEWGAFGDDGHLENYRTKYDRVLDEQSVNAGRQRFEKMISGMYLGELVRLILEELTREGLLFRNSPSPTMLRNLAQHGMFSTKLLSDIENLLHEQRPLSKVADLMREIGIHKCSPTDCAIVANVCSLISTRSAHLCAAGIAALLNRMDRPFVAVGVDGSVYKCHPTFKDLMAAKIQQLVDPRNKFKMILSEDGSGKGAAVAAAVAKKMTDLSANQTASQDGQSRQDAKSKRGGCHLM